MAQISYGVGPFMVIDDKGEKFEQRYKMFGQRYKGDESASMDMTWIKREQY